MSISNFSRSLTLLLFTLVIFVTWAEGKKKTSHNNHPQHNSDSLGLSLEWHAWKSEHGKSYESQKEELQRHIVWQANKKFIEAHNTFNKTLGYTLAMNHFGDMVSVEIIDEARS